VPHREPLSLEHIKEAEGHLVGWCQQCKCQAGYVVVPIMMCQLVIDGGLHWGGGRQHARGLVHEFKLVPGVLLLEGGGGGLLAAHC
jgi:hypothetical protein